MIPERSGSSDSDSDKPIVPANELKFSLKKTGDFVIEHKGELIVVSSIVLAGIVAAAARQHRRGRKK